jgi:hypothetical protein
VGFRVHVSRILAAFPAMRCSNSRTPVLGVSNFFVEFLNLLLVLPEVDSIPVSLSHAHVTARIEAPALIYEAKRAKDGTEQRKLLWSSHTQDSICNLAATATSTNALKRSSGWYEHARPHQGLGGECPVPGKGEKLGEVKGKIVSIPRGAASIIATKGSLRNLETPLNHSSQEELKRASRRLPQFQRSWLTNQIGDFGCDRFFHQYSRFGCLAVDGSIAQSVSP